MWHPGTEKTASFDDFSNRNTVGCGARNLYQPDRPLPAPLSISRERRPANRLAREHASRPCRA